MYSYCFVATVWAKTIFFALPNIATADIVMESYYHTCLSDKSIKKDGQTFY